MKKTLELCIGVIRDAALYRSNSSARQRADAEYKAVRPRIMASQNYRCAFCGYTAKSNHCHHLDGNHANNSDANFAVADALCHAYHHLGQQASQDQFAPENLGKKTAVAVVPELSAADCNLLQRAIGVAVKDPTEAEMAKSMHKLLLDRTTAVKEAFGTFHTGDFAAAMSQMNDEDFASRDAVVADLRLVFREDVLKHEGAKFLEENAALPFASWSSIAKT